MQLLLKPEDIIRDGIPEAFKNPINWTKIPLVNYTPLHLLKDNDIVRFRGMIQDMIDPEIYLEKYEVKAGEDVRLQEGKYRDYLVLKPGEQINHNCSANVHGERRTLFVVSIPGLNDWSKNYELECNKSNIPTIDTAGEFATNVNGVKRPAPEEMDIDEATSTNQTPSNERENKKLCIEMEQNEAKKNILLSPEYLLNSPIPERPGTACMVKIYDDLDKYSLNTVIDVVGFLSMDPNLSATAMDDEMSGFDNKDELEALNPPPSLIPRLHAISVHNLPHFNPLLDPRLTTIKTNIKEDEETLNMSIIQKDLQKLLSLCLFNDDLAADYLLSHLISTVYTRSEMDSIGKFALNLCSLPMNGLETYTKDLYEIIELLLPASHYLPMTLEIMNTSSFIPKKDYNTNKLVSGLLQLAPHTHIVLDETKMQQGKLESQGVFAVQSLAHLINNQQIQCNFQYYNIDYEANIPILVLSEGRSMLPNDFALPIATDQSSINIINETLKAAHHFLQQNNRLNQFRRFLTKARTCDFGMNPDDAEMIQNDFVEMRKANQIKTGDDLHNLLVLSRLLAIARGKVVLDKESWEMAKDYEAKRRHRIQMLPKSRLKTTQKNP